MEWYHIALIAVVVILLVALFARTRSGQREQEDQPQPVAPEQAAGGELTGPDPVDGAVVAVIAAAVLALAGPSERLVVRTIRRADSPESVWAQAGRRDLMNQ